MSTIMNNFALPDPRKVIIFDWDDTILCSSYADRLQVETSKDLPLHFQNVLTELGRCAEKCLDEASRYGEVIIITNSDDGWVKYSAERYAPSLLPLVEKYRVVSARTRYERFYPGQPLCWKAAAFAHEVNEIYEGLKDNNDDANTSCGSMTGTDVSSTSSEESFMDTQDRIDKREIISFGDSMEERTAVRIVAGQLEAVPKSVMFINSPTPIQIIGQLQMLTEHMKFVCDHKNGLDLEISLDQAEKCADRYMRSRNIDYDPRLLHTGSSSRISSQPSEVCDMITQPTG